MDDNIIWTEKYRPKCFEDLLITATEKNSINKWLSTFLSKNKNNSLLLHGPPGIGKTTIAHLILKKYDIDIIEFNASELRNQKVINDKINQINGNINIVNFMCLKKKKIGIIIDELDGINNSEKGSINELIKIISNSKNKQSSPFICITNSLTKKINALKDKSVYIKITKPSRSLIKKTITKILDTEQICIDNDIINIILDRCQCDYRRTIILMEYLFKNNKNYTYDSILKLLNNYDTKNVENTIFDSVNIIFNNYHKDVNYIFNHNRILVGYYIYENFVNYIINNRNEPHKRKINDIIQIYKQFSESDIIDKHIYINQHYELCSDLSDINYCTYYKCNIPSFIINNMKKFSYNKINRLNYSTLINKISMEHLNSKNSNNLATRFNIPLSLNKSIIDIIYIYFINHIDQNKIKSIICLYNINKDLLEKIIKQSSFYNKITTPNLKKKLKILYKK